jgi:ketosteroid isomerase-like protein
MDDARWAAELFRHIDAMDASRFLTYLTEDARFCSGNASPAIGRMAIRAAVEGFFATIKACRHELLNVWSPRDHRICQGEVTYTRHDGREIRLPFVNVLAMRRDLIAD